MEEDKIYKHMKLVTKMILIHVYTGIYVIIVKFWSCYEFLIFTL